MALLKITYKSEILISTVGINVILPEKRIKGMPLPVLYLLHGLSDNEGAWCSQSSIERYVRYRNIAVVMPYAFNSFYSNMPNNIFNWYNHFKEELIPFVRDNFNLSERREDNYIAGLSMGGYGAFKIALLNPEMFCAAASFSGALDIERLARDNDMAAVFDKPLKDTDNDLFYLARRIFKSNVKPRLYQWCGTDDFLYRDNIKFRDYISDLGFDYKYKESVGNHEWKYWDDQISKALTWFGTHNNLCDDDTTKGTVI